LRVASTTKVPSIEASIAAFRLPENAFMKDPGSNPNASSAEWQSLQNPLFDALTAFSNAQKSKDVSRQKRVRQLFLCSAKLFRN
jgi:hypothetical protein